MDLRPPTDAWAASVRVLWGTVPARPRLSHVTPPRNPFLRGTSPELFRSYGLIGLPRIPYLDPQVIRYVILATKVAWVLAAIGLFSRASAIATAVGVAFLHGMFMGSNSLNHNWFLPMYAMIALCFARTSDPWSADYHLKRWWTGRPPKPEGMLADTGLARKVVLVLAVGFCFTAGMSKLWGAGLSWADGHTIAYFARERGGGDYLLGPLLAENLWLCAVLAVGTLALELGSPAALFSRKARYALIIGWTLMHIGIRLSMGPRYRENVVVLALLIDWSALGRALGERMRIPALANIQWPPPRAARAAGRRSVGGVGVASLVLLLVLGMAIFQVFWWPLTTVHMYSSYFSLPREIRADHPRADYHDPAAVQHIARGYLQGHHSAEDSEYFVSLAELRLAGGGSEPSVLSDIPGATEKQWLVTVVRPVLIEDFAAKPTGRIEFDPDHPDFPAQQLLLEYLPVLRRHGDPALLSRDERLELAYPLNGRPVVMPSVPLNVKP